MWRFDEAAHAWRRLPDMPISFGGTSVRGCSVVEDGMALRATHRPREPLRIRLAR